MRRPLASISANPRDAGCASTQIANIHRARDRHGHRVNDLTASSPKETDSRLVTGRRFRVVRYLNSRLTS